MLYKVSQSTEPSDFKLNKSSAQLTTDRPITKQSNGELQQISHNKISPTKEKKTIRKMQEQSK